MDRWARGVLFANVFSGLCVWQAAASAADDPARDEARKLAYAGVADYQAADYRAASEKLEKAFAMLPAPSVGLYSARALAKLGRLTAAAARYRQISQLVITAGERSVQEVARKNAAADLSALEPRIPVLSLQLEGATADQVQVALDGATVSASELNADIRIDPGTHELQGRRGAQLVKSSVELHEGEHISAVLRFSPEVASAPQAPPPTPPSATPTATPEQASSSLRTAGWVGLAAGGAGLVLSGASFLIARAEEPSGCAQHVCGGSVSGYNTWRAVSTVGFYAGVALGAAGVTLLLAAPKTNSSAQGLSFTLHANAASFEGSF